MRVDLFRLSAWLRYSIALAVTAVVVLLAYVTNGMRPAPGWITAWLIPALGWVVIAYVAIFILSRIVRRRP